MNYKRPVGHPSAYDGLLGNQRSRRWRFQDKERVFFSERLYYVPASSVLSSVQALVEVPGPTPPELTADTSIMYAVKAVRLASSAVFL